MSQLKPDNFGTVHSSKLHKATDFTLKSWPNHRPSFSLSGPMASTAAVLLSPPLRPTPSTLSPTLLPPKPTAISCRSPSQTLHPRMSSNGYPSPTPAAARIAGKPYRRLDSCLVIPPPAGRKPHSIIKFLGGAFVGAVPEVTYGYLMELLAKEEFLVVSVPYKVTFDHEAAAREVYGRFHSAMGVLFSSGLPDVNLSASDLLKLPLYSVGHSNGALLQLLIGCYHTEKLPQANVVVSFNNRPASEAVPYFEQFGPLVSQVMPIMEANPMYSMARNASGDAWKALLDTAGTLVQDYDQEAVMSLTKFVDQLPSVMNQVAQGTSEFKPTPKENREFFKISYNVPKTLLVKFSLDAIDETDVIEDILRPRVESIGGTLEKVTLSGNHLTPCVQDVRWQVGYQYTPADALAQGLKSLSLNDTRVLARTIADWLKDLNNRHHNL